ncbi:HTH domain-containing protein, partial [Clostridium perfringens]
MKLSQRQEEIIRIVKEGQPVTSETLADKLGVTRAALRADLAILTMIGILDARPKVGYVYLGEAHNTRILENISKVLV